MHTTHIFSFPPIADESATLLILGTMPGKASLQAQQYYAHPRNAFWPILGQVLHFDPKLTYSTRVNIVLQRRLAIWDVLQSCQRPGSLDSAIVPSSVVPNDFPSFLERHPSISGIAFNGGSAAKLFGKYVQPQLPKRWQSMVHWQLPSTSPAFAAKSFEQKLAAWQVLVEILNLGGKTYPHFERQEPIDRL